MSNDLRNSGSAANFRTVSRGLSLVYIGSALPLKERALISRLRSRVRTPGRRTGTGIGDDCAVLPVSAREDVLVTTDFSLEGIHFRREWHPAESVGHRCLARGLSDIAAMGGKPNFAFLSLALPRNLPQSWVDRFLDGFLRLARESSVILVGGDTAESQEGVLADIVVVGSVATGTAVLRSGARPGHNIYVSGELGGSAAAVGLLLSGKKRKLRPSDFSAHFYPQPPVEVGRFLRENKIASAMIDISDGLSTDLAHLCEESAVGAEVLPESIPRASIGKPAQFVSLNDALHGGEAYELLFTAPAGTRVPSRIAGFPITRIGEITSRRGMRLKRKTGLIKLLPQGWEHFQKSRCP
jgi:thiamine-monophosphate kinase